MVIFLVRLQVSGNQDTKNSLELPVTNLLGITAYTALKQEIRVFFFKLNIKMFHTITCHKFTPKGLKNGKLML